MRRSFYIPIAAFAVVLFLPLVSNAASFSGSIFPVSQCTCAGGAPDWSCFVLLIQNALNAALFFGSLIISIFIAQAGYAYMTSGSNAGARSKARSRIINAVIGFVIVLASWLVVNSVLSVIYNTGATSADGQVVLPAWTAIFSENAGHYCITGHSINMLVGPSSANATGNTGATSPISTPNAPQNASGAGGACSASNIESSAAAEGVTIPASTANALACVAKPESNCGAINPNYNWGNGSSAYGPFQITLQGNAQYFNNPACEAAVGSSGPLNCQTGFSGGNPIPGSQVAATCEQAAANLGCSSAAASELYSQKGIQPWTTDSHATSQGSCGI